MEYLNLDLLFNRIGKKYQIRFDSPAGQTTIEFKNPFAEAELDEFYALFGRIRTRTKRSISQQVDVAKKFGATLFETVFVKDARVCLQSSLLLREKSEEGLRIRLLLTHTPELADLPWEFLYNQGLNRFLSLFDKTPVVRFLDLEEPIRPLTVIPPLKILVMISCPKDYPKLNADRELETLTKAVSGLIDKKVIAIDVIENSTLNTLSRYLKNNMYHIFHYIGHGAFDNDAQDGILVLEEDEGRSCLIRAEQLGMLMHGSTNLRLVILNACEGARTSIKNLFAGSAQSLIQQGIPAVIAMQSEISDDGAIMFSEEFYSHLSEGKPVDEALSQTRLMMNLKRNDVEWGIPALYMRSSDGHIFNIKHPSPPKRIEQQLTSGKKTKIPWISIIAIILITVISILLLNTLNVKSTQIELQMEISEFSFRAYENWHLYSLEAEKLNISDLDNLAIDIFSVEQKMDSSTEVTELTNWIPVEVGDRLNLRGTRPDWGITIESRYLNLTSLYVDSGVLVHLSRDRFKSNQLKLRFSDGHIAGNINTSDTLILTGTNCQIGDSLKVETDISKKLRILPFDNQVEFRDKDESLQIQIDLSKQISQTELTDLFPFIPIRSIDFTTAIDERIESTIVNDALIYLTKIDNKQITVHDGDFIIIGDLKKFEINRLALKDNFILRLTGKVGELKTGPRSFIRSQMPSYLEWLYANQAIALFLTGLLPMLLIIFLILHRSKSVKTKKED